MLNDNSWKETDSSDLEANTYNYLTINNIDNQAGLEDVNGNQGLDTPNDSDKRCTGIHWFVMRDLKRRNAKLPAYLLFEREKIEVFTPMKKVPVMIHDRKTYRDVPFIQDLLFVHSSAEILRPILQRNPTIQFRYMRGGRYMDPMKVPDEEMERFIRAVRNSESLRYYTPEELTPAMYGRKVHIIGGPLDNYEGRLLKGRKKKVLIIQLQGFLSAGVEVSPEYIRLV